MTTVPINLNMVKLDAELAQVDPIPSDAALARLWERATRELERAVPRVSARLATGEVSFEDVGDVLTAMVLRVLRNPIGARSVGIDDAQHRGLGVEVARHVQQQAVQDLSGGGTAQHVTQQVPTDHEQPHAKGQLADEAEIVQKRSQPVGNFRPLKRIHERHPSRGLFDGGRAGGSFGWLFPQDRLAFLTEIEKFAGPSFSPFGL